jgi:hypothetical protein
MRETLDTVDMAQGHQQHSQQSLELHILNVQPQRSWSVTKVETVSMCYIPYQRRQRARYSFYQEETVR